MRIHMTVLAGVILSMLCGAGAAQKAEPAQAPVFVGGEGGYHTYRIPAIVISKKGTVLAFCEGRRNSQSDDGDIDLVLRRSFDGGAAFESTQVVWQEDGDVTIGNPCPVVDQSSGTIWLPFCRNNDRVFVTRSEDDGATWAAPVEITQAVKPADWMWYATGPVHGVQLSDGRLLIPCDHGTKGIKENQSHVIFSDDHGATWKLGGILGPKTDECAAAQRVDGSVYLNMRSYEGKNRRAVATSQDGGNTWSDVTLDETLVEPVCQASVIRFSDGDGGNTPRLLFSNPADVKRFRMTVRVSNDEGKTWSAGRLLYEGPSAYSDLAVLPDKTILCLYERGVRDAYEMITLARFSMGWLEEK